MITLNPRKSSNLVEKMSPVELHKILLNRSLLKLNFKKILGNPVESL